jgi:AcrR family transcriptional regulator
LLLQQPVAIISATEKMPINIKAKAPSRDDGGVRRTHGIRVHGRAARVTENVLHAVVEELGRVGFTALRFEDVASRAGVNRTTIYRRWPTKVSLVTDAILAYKSAPRVESTGSLREDLIAVMKASVAYASSPLGRGIVRMMLTERDDPDVARTAALLRVERLRSTAELVEKGVARGELPRGTNAALVADLAAAPIMGRAILRREEVTDAYIRRVIDVVLAGARAGAAIGD